MSVPDDATTRASVTPTTRRPAGARSLTGRLRGEHVVDAGLRAGKARHPRPRKLSFGLPPRRDREESASVERLGRAGRGCERDEHALGESLQPDVRVSYEGELLGHDARVFERPPGFLG